MSKSRFVLSATVAPLVPRAAMGVARARHLNVRYHYTHDLVKDGVVRIQKIDTKFIPSDALTKALGSKDHERHALVLLGMAAIEGV